MCVCVCVCVFFIKLKTRDDDDDDDSDDGHSIQCIPLLQICWPNSHMADYRDSSTAT